MNVNEFVWIWPASSVPMIVVPFIVYANVFAKLNKREDETWKEFGRMSDSWADLCRKRNAEKNKLIWEGENYRSLAEHYAGEADRLANDGSRKFLTECEKTIEEIER